MKVSKMTYLKDNLRKSIGESVTHVDVMERIYNKTRGQKNTVALLTAARKHKAVIICLTKEWADKLSKNQDVDAMVYTDSKLLTYEGPVLMDMPVMWEFTQAFARLEKKSTELLDFMDLKKVD